MISKLLWKAERLSRRLWVKASLYGVVGISTALAAVWIGPHLPDGLPRSVGANAVDAILQIIASSMLAVTTFSLSTLVSATATAAGSATPRATRLLLEDPTAQRALSTFLGAFLFSLVGLIALNTDLYGDGGRFVLFIATLVVIALIVITLLRWMDHLAGLGNMGETISRVERSAEDAYRSYCHDPLLGGVPATALPAGAIPVFHNRIGYLQHIDVAHLQGVAEELKADIQIARLPGAHCDPACPVAHLLPRETPPEDMSAALADICSAFSVGDRRSYEADPRFGLIALSEIGSRALSPGINDPGTAIDVLAALTRILSITEEKTRDEKAPEPDYPDVRVPRLSCADLVDAAFMPISRDGAGMVEVAIRLQKSLAAIRAAHRNSAPTSEMKTAIGTFSASALDRSTLALSYPPDRERLKSEVSMLAGTALPPGHETSA